MQVLWDSKMRFVSVSQMLGLTSCFLFGSFSGPFTAPGLTVSLGGKTKQNKNKNQTKTKTKPKQNKTSLLLTLTLPGKFCWSSWMPSLRGIGLRFSPFLWFWEDGDQVATTTFTIAQPLAHVLCELPGSNQPLSPWVCRASQLSSSQPLSLWACTAQITLGASSPLLKIS